MSALKKTVAAAVILAAHIPPVFAFGTGNMPTIPSNWNTSRNHDIE